jgi:hypothetical protein
MSSSRPTTSVSRRTALAGLGAGGAALALSAARPAIAQDAATAHPLVGAWLVAVPADPSRTVALNTYGADGNVQVTIDTGNTSHGTWEVTGPHTAALTVVGFAPDPNGGPTGLVTLRGSIEVDETGQSFHGEGDEAVALPDGTVLGPFPNAVVGTRITVQSAGTPVPGTPAS